MHISAPCGGVYTRMGVVHSSAHTLRATGAAQRIRKSMAMLTAVRLFHGNVFDSTCSWQTHGRGRLPREWEWWLRHRRLVRSRGTRFHLAGRAGSRGQGAPFAHTKNNFRWKMRISDQIAIQSTLHRQNIYLVNVWIVRYVVLGTSPWHGTCRSRAGQHGYPFSGYIRSVLDRRGTAR